MPTWIGRVENALGKSFVSPPQIHDAVPSSTNTRPIVTTTTARTLAFSTGRMTVRSIAIPPRNAIPSVAKNAPQYPKPQCISCQAMYVVNIAIAPWAKLITSVAR